MFDPSNVNEITNLIIKSHTDKDFRIKLIQNFKEALKHGTTGVHRDAQLYAKDWVFNLRDIKKKIYIWHGAKDLTVPVTASNYFKSKIKNNEIFIKPNEGHFSICYHFMNDIIQQVSA